MPGIFRYSPDKILEEIDEISTLGIKGIILFGIPLKKDPNGKNSFNDKGIVQETIKSIKKNFGEKLDYNYGCMSMPVYITWPLWNFPRK